MGKSKKCEERRCRESAYQKISLGHESEHVDAVPGRGPHLCPPLSPEQFTASK